MRYEDFRDTIRAELRRATTGLTRAQLQARLALPYARPCPTWVKRLEQEIGLTRTNGPPAAPPPNSRTAQWKWVAQAISPAERGGSHIPPTTQQTVRVSSSFRAASCRAERAARMPPNRQAGSLTHAQILA